MAMAELPSCFNKEYPHPNSFLFSGYIDSLFFMLPYTPHRKKEEEKKSLSFTKHNTPTHTNNKCTRCQGMRCYLSLVAGGFSLFILFPCVCDGL
jgi:hypothetical protein